MVGRRDSNPFDKVEVNSLADEGPGRGQSNYGGGSFYMPNTENVPSANSRLSPLPHEPADYDRGATVDIPFAICKYYKIINAELFKHLKQIHGKSYQAFMLSKLVPVVENVCETNIVLDEDAAGFMANEADVIINFAASITFDERYDTALDINTGGPTRLMSFAKQCLKLKLFLQVSTAYVNGQRQGRIMEKPFSMGESLADETVLYTNHHQLSLPKLSVEDEIKIVLDSK